MRKLLEELFKEFPDLKDNYEALEVFIKHLKNKKDNIKIPAEFKKNLRNRLNNIVIMKTGKTKKFWFFTIPALAAFFVVFGFYAIYKDLLPLNFNSIEIISVDEKSANDNGNDIEEPLLDDFTSKIIPMKGVKFDTNTGNEIETESVDDLITEEIEGVMGLMNQLLMDVDVQKTNVPKTFEEFCIEHSGSIIKTSSGNICSTPEGECFEVNYNDTCEFIHPIR